MSDRIYTRDRDRKLEHLKEEPFCSESALQKLIAEYPELLDDRQMRPQSPRRWILITREKGIAESSGASERWSLDHLLIDQDAIPTLVEVKRSSNPQLQREVVGQLLVYAAHAAVTWTADDLRQTFENEGSDKGFSPTQEISNLLESGSEPNVDAFWEKVATNLAARRLRLLFVADEIPAPLERVVSFLNEQMPNIEVLAVEIKQYNSGSFQTIVPRVIGKMPAIEDQSVSVTEPRTNLTPDSFLDQLPSEEARSAAKKLLNTAKAAGATLQYGSTSVSIRMKCNLYRQPISVAWLHPLPDTPFWQGFRNFTFGSAIENYSLPTELRTKMNIWKEEFEKDDFASHISGKETYAWAVSYPDAAKQIDLLTCRLKKVLTELKKL